MCRKQKASVIFLQETHSTRDKEEQMKAEWGAPIEIAHGRSGKRSVAILLRYGFDCKIKRRIVDPMGRYIGIKAEIKDENYLLFNVYAPNNDSQSAKFYEHIVNVLKKEDQIYADRIIFGGDFNCPLNPSLDKMRGILIIMARKKIVDQMRISKMYLMSMTSGGLNTQIKRALHGHKSPHSFSVHWIIVLYRILCMIW